MTDGISTLSTITTIPKQTLEKLFEKLSWVICDSVEVSCMSNEDFARIDIGIGYIDINVTENELEYRFIPSKKLESDILNTVQNKKNPLVNNIEESLIKRIINAYKDFF